MVLFLFCIFATSFRLRNTALYDVNGRVLAVKRNGLGTIRFDVAASGAYLIKVGNHPARKIVVVR